MADRRGGKRRKTPKARAATLTIDRLGGSGDGLANDIAVPFTLPGEVVRAQVAGRKAAVTAIEAPSAVRASPVCGHFGLPGDGCGGCKLQHLGHDAYGAFKRDRLLGALARSGMALPPLAVHGSPERSRRRAKFSYERRGERVVCGFRALGSDRLVVLTECHILTPELFELAKASCAIIAALPVARSAKAMITMTATGADLAVIGVDEAEMSLAQREAATRLAQELDVARLSVGGVTVVERRVPQLVLGGVTVELPAGAFLQATREGEAALVRLVSEGVGEAASVADLFCGIGTFALPLSERSRVLAVEGDETATNALACAAVGAKRPVMAKRRDLFAQPLAGPELAGIDAVVLDPPRAGAVAQCQALAASDVARVVYVSCNPDALARDLRVLSGCYDLTGLAMVDQFVWSPHIEAVAVLERR